MVSREWEEALTHARDARLHVEEIVHCCEDDNSIGDAIIDEVVRVENNLDLIIGRLERG